VNTSMFATNLLFFKSEQKLQRLNQLLGRPVQVEMPRVSDWISRFTAASRMQLSEQQQAVEMAKQTEPYSLVVREPHLQCELSLLYGKQWVNLLS